MSVAGACGWSMLRGAIIALAALPVAALLAGLADGCRGNARRLAWFLIVVPFLVPELLLGYAYANAPLGWRVESLVLNELLYSLLVAIRVVPVGVLALYFAPPPALSREALHCRRLAYSYGGNSLRQFVGLALGSLEGRARALFPAFAVMFLLVFQDFELASRLEVNSVPATWSVRVYDAHAGGLAVGESLRLILWPVLVELSIVIPAVLVVAMSWNLAAASRRGQKEPRPWARVTGWVYLATAALVVGAIPLVLVFRNAADGLGVFAQDAVRKGKVPFLSEILTSAAFAIVAGLGASLLASRLQKRLRQTRSWLAAPVGTVLSSAPGLVGSLVLSLAVLALIQLPVLSFFYRNSLPLHIERAVASVPLALTLVVWLFPRALAMTLLLSAASPPEPVHAASLLSDAVEPSQRGAGQMLLWQLKSRGIFWTTALLCYWAYWDLTAPSILMPVGMVAAPVRLYNFMHYSQSAMLSAMLCVTMAFPLVVLAVLALLHRPALRWLSR